MIVRQIAVRRGRSAIASSLQCTKRAYASEISHEYRAFGPSDSDKPEKTIPGHPSDPSSILDQSNLAPTRETREVAERIANVVHEFSAVQGDFNAFIAARSQQQAGRDTTVETTSEQPSIDSKKNSQRLDAFYNSRRQQRKLSNLGSNLVNVYEPWEIVKNPPKPDDITLPMLLANQTHLGHATSLWNPANSSYIFGVREGIHIISLEITLAYLRRATKIVREVARRGGIILFVGTRKGQQEIVVNAAKLASGYHIFDRWIGGLLTNGQQILENCAMKVVNSTDKEIEEYRGILSESNTSVLRPDLVICLNPLENESCLHECGLYNVPTIGIVDTDANPTWVTYPIPANDDSFRSVGLIAGALGRAGHEGQQMRLDAAKNGELTFNTRKVSYMLSQMTELSSRGVQPEGSKEEA